MKIKGKGGNPEKKVGCFFWRNSHHGAPTRSFGGVLLLGVGLEGVTLLKGDELVQVEEDVEEDAAGGARLEVRQPDAVGVLRVDHVHPAVPGSRRQERKRSPPPPPSHKKPESCDDHAPPVLSNFSPPPGSLRSPPGVAGSGVAGGEVATRGGGNIDKKADGRPE